MQQPTRHYTLDGKSITPGFHVEESVWKRDMPTQHTVEILFLCGTDAIRTTFVVPVNNYTDAEYDQLLSAQYPYKLEVVRNQCTVLVYGLDMSGDYSILYHAFVCGPGPDHAHRHVPHAVQGGVAPAHGLLGSVLHTDHGQLSLPLLTVQQPE